MVSLYKGKDWASLVTQWQEPTCRCRGHRLVFWSGRFPARRGNTAREPQLLSPSSCAANPEAHVSRACTPHGRGPHIPKPLHPEPAHHTAEAHRLQPEPTGCSDWSPGTSTCSATKQLQWEAYKLQRRASLHLLQLEKAHVKQLRPSTAIKGGRITQKGKKYLKHSLRYNFHE